MREKYAETKSVNIKNHRFRYTKENVLVYALIIRKIGKENSKIFPKVYIASIYRRKVSSNHGKVY